MRFDALAGLRRDNPAVPTVAALYVDPRGPYWGRPDVDAWGEREDARRYDGPLPVVAHPPCQRWGKLYWRGPGGTRGKLGDDGGCFAAALSAVEEFGGVLEHPEASLAWKAFGLPRPVLGTWTKSLTRPGWSCVVDQGTYGHRAKKRTWLYYVGELPPAGIDLRPYEGDVLRVKSGTHRVGIEAMGKEERRITPPRFAEALLALARRARGRGNPGDEDLRRLRRAARGAPADRLTRARVEAEKRRRGLPSRAGAEKLRRAGRALAARTVCGFCGRFDDERGECGACVTCGAALCLHGRHSCADLAAGHVSPNVEFQGLSVADAAERIFESLDPLQVCYAGDPSRGRYRGFRALHDLFDANELVLEQVRFPGSVVSWLPWVNAVENRVGDRIVDAWDPDGPRVHLDQRTRRLVLDRYHGGEPS